MQQSVPSTAFLDAGLQLPYPQRNFDMEFSFSWLWILVEVPRLFLGESDASSDWFTSFSIDYVGMIDQLSCRPGLQLQRATRQSGGHHCSSAFCSAFRFWACTSTSSPFRPTCKAACSCIREVACTHASQSTSKSTTPHHKHVHTPSTCSLTDVSPRFDYKSKSRVMQQRIWSVHHSICCTSYSHITCSCCRLKIDLILQGGSIAFVGLQASPRC